ncbi:unnamed protein product [Sphagnum balticum]
MKKSACDNNTVPGSTDYATKAIERALPCKTYNTLNAHEKEIINNRHFDHNRQGVRPLKGMITTFIKQHDKPNPSADPELFHDFGEVQIDTRKKVQTDTREKASAAAVTLKSSPKM